MELMVFAITVTFIATLALTPILFPMRRSQGDYYYFPKHSLRLTILTSLMFLPIRLPQTPFLHYPFPLSLDSASAISPRWLQKPKSYISFFRFFSGQQDILKIAYSLQI
jgi:hypothetical protein